MGRLLILGAGTAGTMMANKLVRRLDDDWTITVVDQDDDHLYQPGLLLLPFGTYRPEQLVRSRTRLFDPRVEVRLTGVDRVLPDERTVVLGDGTRLGWDVLILATGSRILPELTPGLTGPGFRDSVHEFYTLDGAIALGRALDRFEGGRVVINVVENPIKCPVAPLEMAFLLEAWLTERGLRSRSEVVYATPLDAAFTKPRASAALGDMLCLRGVGVTAEFNTERVDGEGGVLVSYDGREEPFDLLVTIPAHAGAQVITDSQLGDETGWVPTDKHTLQSRLDPSIFVLGDATNLPTSKAGAVAHFEADVLTDNVLRFIEERPLLPDFDGHANCFIETGHGQAMLIDFNYETEPLPGRFPLPGIGPFRLLEESPVNHWGKLAFKSIYWNLLLRGEDLPLDHRMVMSGKWSA